MKYEQKKLLTLERANGQIKSTGNWYDLISKHKGVKKLNLERLNIRLGLTTVRLAFLSSVSSKKYVHNLWKNNA